MIGENDDSDGDSCSECSSDYDSGGDYNPQAKALVGSAAVAVAIDSS